MRFITIDHYLERQFPKSKSKLKRSTEPQVSSPSFIILLFRLQKTKVARKRTPKKIGTEKVSPHSFWWHPYSSSSSLSLLSKDSRTILFCRRLAFGSLSHNPYLGWYQLICSTIAVWFNYQPIQPVLPIECSQLIKADAPAKPFSW